MHFLKWLIEAYHGQKILGYVKTFCDSRRRINNLSILDNAFVIDLMHGNGWRMIIRMIMKISKGDMLNQIDVTFDEAINAKQFDEHYNFSKLNFSTIKKQGITKKLSWDNNINKNLSWSTSV